MNEERVVNLLGLAQKARKLQSGDFIVEKIMKRKAVPLVLLAGDAAENNEKKYLQLAKTYSISLRRVLTKEILGRAIGKEERVVIAVTDEGFAKALLKEIDTMEK